MDTRECTCKNDKADKQWCVILILQCLAMKRGLKNNTSTDYERRNYQSSSNAHSWNTLQKSRAFQELQYNLLTSKGNCHRLKYIKCKCMSFKRCLTWKIISTLKSIQKNSKPRRGNDWGISRKWRHQSLLTCRWLVLKIKRA